MNYGQRLKAARKHKKLTQPQLAELSGVGQGSISKIERGDQEVSAFDIELAYALDVSPLWLKTGNKKHAPDWLSEDFIKDVQQELPRPESNAKYEPSEVYSEVWGNLSSTTKDLVYEIIAKSVDGTLSEESISALKVLIGSNKPEKTNNTNYDRLLREAKKNKTSG